MECGKQTNYGPKFDGEVKQNIIETQNKINERRRVHRKNRSTERL